MLLQARTTPLLISSADSVAELVDSTCPSTMRHLHEPQTPLRQAPTIGRPAPSMASSRFYPTYNTALLPKAGALSV